MKTGLFSHGVMGMAVWALFTVLAVRVQAAEFKPTSGCPLPPPFDTEPFDTDARGNAASSLFGCFRVDGGPQQRRYFIGTNGGPGSLIMDFAVPFTDGPGNDFVILTNSEGWGPLADKAQFKFFLRGQLQASFIASLSPDQLFEFDLPGIVADRVVVTNITPDPPGLDDLATMTFDDAGVAYLVAPPPAIQGSLAVDGSSVDGADVILKNKVTKIKTATTTDDTGAYQFDPVDPGTYKVKVKNFVVGATSTVSGNLLVKGVAGAGVNVRLKNMDTKVAVKTTTDGSGAFLFPGVDPGTYRVIIPEVIVP